MAGITNFMSGQVYDHLFGKATWTAPANVFVGLFTAAPSDAGGGTEVSGNGYARVSTSSATWTANTNGAGDNAAAITFAAASGGNWGTITHMGLFDALTSGNLLAWAALTTSRVVNDTQVFEFVIGDLDVDFNNN